MSIILGIIGVVLLLASAFDGVFNGGDLIGWIIVLLAIIVAVNKKGSKA